MIARPFHVLALACMMSVTTSVLAQSTPTNVSPDVMLRALETMNSAASSKLSQSIKREASLQAYIAKNDLADPCGGSSKSNEAHDMAMSFDQALKIAVDHEQSTRGSYDSPATASELRAYTTLTQSTWDKLQASMANVEHMSDCIHGKDKFSDYLGWSEDQRKSNLAAAEKKNAEVSKEHGAEHKELQKKEASQYTAFQASQKTMHEQFLKQSWTKYKFDQTNDLKAYKYRTEYGPNSYYNTYAGSIYGGRGGYGYGY
jgi:hypothetical protein